MFAVTTKKKKKKKKKKKTNKKINKNKKNNNNKQTNLKHTSPKNRIENVKLDRVTNISSLKIYFYF